MRVEFKVYSIVLSTSCVFVRACMILYDERIENHLTKERYGTGKVVSTPYRCQHSKQSWLNTTVLLISLL